QLAPHSHGLPGGGTTDLAGGGQPFNNLQPSLTLHYMIALQGEFPTPGGDIGNANFLGQLALFAGNFAPNGWAFCDGQLMPVSQNTALFAILGTTYGGNGASTFALPDLRGRTIIGAGSGIGLSNYSPGEVLGVENITLTVNQL